MSAPDQPRLPEQRWCLDVPTVHDYFGVLRDDDQVRYDLAEALIDPVLFASEITPTQKVNYHVQRLERVNDIDLAHETWLLQQAKLTAVNGALRRAVANRNVPYEALEEIAQDAVHTTKVISPWHWITLGQRRDLRAAVTPPRFCLDPETHERSQEVVRNLPRSLGSLVAASMIAMGRALPHA